MEVRGFTEQTEDDGFVHGSRLDTGHTPIPLRVAPPGFEPGLPDPE